jgi:dipeptidyl aminopeptidase/acylaminoacyl peptidase
VELQGPAKGTEDRLTLPIGVFPGFSDTASSESSPLILTTRSPTYWALNGIFLTDSVRRFKGKSVAESDARSGRSPHLMTDELFIVDVETKTTEQLTKDDKEYFNPDWSPDGLEIAFASTSGKELIGYGPGNSNIYAINVGTRNVRPIATGIGEKRLPSWSPDGKWIAYSGGQHLRRLATYIVPSSGGTGLDITARLDRNVRTFYWAPDGKSIIITCDDGVSEPVIRLQVPNGEMQKVTRGEAYRWPLAVSHKGRIAWVQSDGEAAGLIYIADDNGNDLHILLDINPQIREWSIGKQEVVRWKNSKGELIEGILIKPVGYRRGKRYPVIVDPYSCRYNSFMAGPLGGNQAFASSGYAVFFPNHRSPHMASNLMKSEAYSRVARGPAGVDIMVDDIMSGISMLARKGIIDSKRMCLYGFSNGGGSVDLLVTKTMQFKCAVSASGVLSDWALTFFLTPMGSTVPYLAGGATPWQDPQAYIKLSPIYHLNNITTPMLLAVGDEDHDTLLSNVEMYYGLRYLNREVTLLRYPNQGHGFTGSALDDYWGRANAFLRFYLLSPGKNTK